MVCILPGLDENREGNAEFIVRAVNSHDELVEALEKIVFWREQPFAPLSIEEAGEIALKAYRNTQRGSKL